MTEKEVRKLGRRDLLEMLLVQARELEDVKRQLSEKTRELEAASTAPRTTSDPAEPETAGSIAEAALQLNGLFELAQAAGQQYVENVRRLSDRQAVSHRLHAFYDRHRELTKLLSIYEG